MSETTHNGWTNRATMLVNKHWAKCIEPGQTFHTFRVFMEQEVAALHQPWMKDFFQLDQVDWQQLEDVRTHLTK